MANIGDVIDENEALKQKLQSSRETNKLLEDRIAELEKANALLLEQANSARSDEERWRHRVKLLEARCTGSVRILLAHCDDKLDQLL